MRGRTAVVVGGTRGIGRATALALAEAGAHVVTTGRTRAAADAVAAEIAGAGGHADGVAVDVTDPEATRAALDDVAERLEGIDVLVANAGVNPLFVRPEELTPQQWDEIMAVNLRGVFFAVQAGARHMLRQRRGSIVSVSSVTASSAVPRGLPYVASKGGLNAMTRTLAAEWADRNVRVNAVAPGYVATDLTAGFQTNERLSSWVESKTPLGRFGTPEEIASLIVYLASDQASYITGQVVAVDGGFST